MAAVSPDGKATLQARLDARFTQANVDGTRATTIIDGTTKGADLNRYDIIRVWNVSEDVDEADITAGYHNRIATVNIRVETKGGEDIFQALKKEVERCVTTDMINPTTTPDGQYQRIFPVKWGGYVEYPDYHEVVGTVELKSYWESKT